MYKNIKRYQKYKNIKVDNNYLCARTCDSDCSFTTTNDCHNNRVMERSSTTPKCVEHMMSFYTRKSINYIPSIRLSLSAMYCEPLHFGRGGHVLANWLSVSHIIICSPM